MKLRRANTLMIERHGRDLVARDAALPRRLAAILAKGLVESEGCIFLKGMSAGYNSEVEEYCGDKTGYECFVNHIHIDDHTRKNMVLVAVTFLTKLSAMLKAQYPDYEFRGEISEGDSVIVRFHRLRSGEQWLLDDLEKYKEEGVCEFML